MKLTTATIGAMLLAGCDSEAERAYRAAQLEARMVEIVELKQELARVEAELAKERETRARECAVRASPGDADPQRLAGLIDPPGPGPLGGTTGSGAPIDFSTIQCAADRCQVPRKILDALAADPGQLVKQVRIVPHMKDGAARGFKLFAIRAGSPLAVMGLQNGDVVTTVGELAISGPDQALAAYAALKGRSEWTIAGERKGAAFVLTVVITG